MMMPTTPSDLFQRATKGTIPRTQSVERTNKKIAKATSIPIATLPAVLKKNLAIGAIT
jgi:hypothetical protein